MPELTPLSATTALAAAYLPSAGPAERGLKFVAVESVARVKGLGPRASGGRGTVFAAEHEDETRASRAPLGGDHAASLASGRRDDPFAGPSIGFLAQYIGQALIGGDDIAAAQTGTGYAAYRSAAESGTTYLGLQAPIDLSV